MIVSGKLSRTLEEVFLMQLDAERDAMLARKIGLSGHGDQLARVIANHEVLQSFHSRTRNRLEQTGLQRPDPHGLDRELEYGTIDFERVKHLRHVAAYSCVLAIAMDACRTLVTGPPHIKTVMSQC